MIIFLIAAAVAGLVASSEPITPNNPPVEHNHMRQLGPNKW